VLSWPGEDTSTLGTSSKCHLRVRRFIDLMRRLLISILLCKKLGHHA